MFKQMKTTEHPGGPRRSSPDGRRKHSGESGEKRRKSLLEYMASKQSPKSKMEESLRKSGEQKSAINFHEDKKDEDIFEIASESKPEPDEQAEEMNKKSQKKELPIGEVTDNSKQYVSDFGIENNVSSHHTHYQQHYHSSHAANFDNKDLDDDIDIDAILAGADGGDFEEPLMSTSHLALNLLDTMMHNITERMNGLSRLRDSNRMMGDDFNGLSSQQSRKIPVQ